MYACTTADEFGVLGHRHAGTCPGPIALSGCILIAVAGDLCLCHGRSAGVVDCLRWPVALVHVVLALVEPADSRTVMPEVFRAAGLYNRQ